jgi:hypothetical protein
MHQPILSPFDVRFRCRHAVAGPALASLDIPAAFPDAARVPFAPEGWEAQRTSSRNSVQPTTSACQEAILANKENRFAEFTRGEQPAYNNRIEMSLSLRKFQPFQRRVTE